MWSEVVYVCVHHGFLYMDPFPPIPTSVFLAWLEIVKDAAMWADFDSDVAAHTYMSVQTQQWVFASLVSLLSGRVNIATTFVLLYGRMAP